MSTTRAPFFTRWRVAASGLAAALVLAFMVGTDPGRAIAAQFLAQFRSQRFAVITIPTTSASLDSFASLEGLGTTSGSMGRSTQRVGSVAEASQRVGFTVKQPDASTIPAGLSTTPTVSVAQGGEYRFTLDRDKVRAYLDAHGGQSTPFPDKLHGASLVVSVPNMALLEYRDPNGARRGPTLVIGQAEELVVTAEGGANGPVTLDEVRDFVLSLPGLPPETVRQLRSIQDWRNTVPLPVPADRVTWQETSIGGGQGLILADNSGIGSAAIWQHDGRVYGVAGVASASEIKRVADSLR